MQHQDDCHCGSDSLLLPAGISFDKYLWLYVVLFVCGQMKYNYVYLLQVSFF